MTWSLEGELCNLAAASSLAEALVTLRVISREEDLLKVVVIENWSRKGNETHCLTFEVRTPAGNKCLILKACTPSWGPISIEATLEEWLRRREFLSARGINTPALYVAAKGVLIEDFIPLSLTPRLVGQWPDLRPQILKLARVLSEERFLAVDFLNDLRTDGRDIYLVDFGQDLGQPYVLETPRDYRGEVDQWFKRVEEAN